MATILGANTLSTGYTIDNAVRFADGDNDAFNDSEDADDIDDEDDGPQKKGSGNKSGA